MSIKISGKSSIKNLSETSNSWQAGTLTDVYYGIGVRRFDHVLALQTDRYSVVGHVDKNPNVICVGSHVRTLAWLDGTHGM